MAIRGRQPGLGDAARQVSEHASALVRLELRLALQELRRKAARAAGATLLLAVAAAAGGIAVLCGIAAAVAAIALALPVWAALLVVAGGLLLLAGPLSVAGLVLVRGGVPPLPEQALEEARLTKEALRNGRP